MNRAQPDRPVVYVKNNLPLHLSNWANDVGIELRAHTSHEIYSLIYQSDELQLHWFGEENFLPISVQTIVKNRLSSNNLLIKALGKKTKIVADLTCGLGVDAMTIAASGRRVFCLERCAPVAMLLYDGIYRCEQAVANLISLHFNDSRSWLETCTDKLDAIYIDTMFSDKKKSAKSSKQMQILRALAGDDEDADKLLSCALEQNVSRVIVKKTDAAPSLPKRTIAQYKGKTVRFDIYKPV